MAAARISIRIHLDLRRRLQQAASTNSQCAAEVVRAAPEAYLAGRAKPETSWALARRIGLLGCIKGGAGDLSVNRAHFPL
jgi:hypothetical protein